MLLDYFYTIKFMKVENRKHSEYNLRKRKKSLFSFLPQDLWRDIEMPFSRFSRDKSQESYYVPTCRNLAVQHFCRSHYVEKTNSWLASSYENLRAE